MPWAFLTLVAVNPYAHQSRRLSQLCEPQGVFAEEVPFSKGLTAPAGAAGVSPPCVALTDLHRRYRHCSEDCRPACWSTPLRLRFRNARGLRPPLLFAQVRPLTELRLLRCTNEQSAPGAAGVSPPCVTLTHLQRRFCNCSADCRRLVGGRYCNRVRVTTGGLRPPLLCTCVRTSQKSHFPCQCVDRSPRGACAPRFCSRAVRPPAELRLLRCTHAHAPGAAGVSPRWCGNRTCKAATAIVRKTVAGALAHAIAIALP